MLAPLSSLEAYRRDAFATDGVGPDDSTAASWLEAASRIEHAAMVKGAERERLLASFLVQRGVVPFQATPVAVEAVVAAVVSIVRSMEDGAYFRMAYTLLSSVSLLVSTDTVLTRGQIIAHQGRIARLLGESETARELYLSIEQLGSEHSLPELTARAWNGFGLLAQHRGDFPEARRLYSAILDLPGAGLELIASAHHQLMIAAATANDYDTAAQHAWKAFEGASSAPQQTEALVNLAQLLLVSGHARSALRGFAAALARGPVPRVALPTLGGAACAAATALPRPAAKSLVRNFSAKVEDLVRGLAGGAVLPHPAASALVEISEALVLIGDAESAERVADKARELANSYKFYELIHRLEHPPVVPEPVVFAPETEAIVASVESLDGAELVGAL